MNIAIDHVGIPAADPEASARFLGDILGAGRTTAEGPDGEMINLTVGRSALTYFALPDHEPRHIAFRVTQSVLATAIEHLRDQGLPFGNDPRELVERADHRSTWMQSPDLLPRPERAPLRTVRPGRTLSSPSTQLSSAPRTAMDRGART